jgi:hypothetical protein
MIHPAFDLVTWPLWEHDSLLYRSLNLIPGVQAMINRSGGDL